MEPGNPYWSVAKYTFAVIGGGSAAAAIVVGTYKGVKRVLGRVFDTAEREQKADDKAIETKDTENDNATSE